MEKYAQIERKLLDSIDSFKKQKLVCSNNIIKRTEIEHCIEHIANSLSIDYQKELNPTNTDYYFSVNDFQSHLKVFFRYGTYYTRHQMMDRYQ